MPTPEIFGVAPWVAVTAVATWAGAAWKYHREAKQKEIDRDDRIETHRDQLTFDLLQNARQEMATVRVECEDLRGEVRKLRSMEQHFYHFQQSLDHLEALLLADSPEALQTAKRNARAFLNRMKRLNDAKGVIANEAQRNISTVNDVERKIGGDDADQ